MSLKVVHIFFILAASAVSALFGYWVFKTPGQEGLAVWGGISLVISVVLVGYLGWVVKKFRRLDGFALLVLASSFLVPSTAFACPVCYGDPASPITKSANLGIAFLLGVIVVVLSGFGGLFAYWWRNARRAAASEAL